MLIFFGSFYILTSVIMVQMTPNFQKCLPPNICNHGSSDSKLSEKLPVNEFYKIMIIA